MIAGLAKISDPTVGNRGAKNEEDAGKDP